METDSQLHATAPMQPAAGPNVSNAPPPPLPASIALPPCCVRHPAVAAIARCDGCGSAICATCAFDVGSGLHYCPDCVVAPARKLSARRRKLVLASYLLAAACTLAWVAIFGLGAYAGLNPDVSIEAIAGLLGVVSFGCGIAGLITSLVAMDRRLGNPPAVLGAVIWNSILAALLIVLAVVGSLAE